MSTIQNQRARHTHAAEAIERRALQDAFDATPAETRTAMGWRVEEVGGALVSVAANAPSIVINRALGLGTERPATRDAIREIKRRYRDAGTRYFVHVVPEAEPAALREWLEAESFVPQRRWMKFARGAGPAPTPTTPFRIARVDADHAQAFGRVVANAFDLGDAAEGIFPPLTGRPGWHLYGAFSGEELVGTGAIFVHGGHGYLDFGATAPAHRGKGAQSAVLAARVAAARELGCTALFTMTGEAVPGDPQHSYHNIERAGFAPAYLRDNYAPTR